MLTRTLVICFSALFLLSGVPAPAATASPVKAETSVKAAMKDEVDKLRLQQKDQTAKLRAQQKDQRDKLKAEQKAQLVKLKADQHLRVQKMRGQLAAAEPVSSAKHP